MDIASWKIRKVFCLPIVAIVFFGWSSVWGNTITIDPTVKFQTIDGFGWHGAMDLYWNRGPFYNARWASLVIDTLGLTISRNAYDDLDSFKTKEKDALLALKKQAEASHEPLQFIFSVWSPPADMKISNKREGGALSPSAYKDFGNWLVDAVKAYKDAGLPLYAISPQNEPSVDANDHFTCVYKPASDFVAMFKTIAPIVKAKFPKVRIFASENCCLDFKTGGFNADLLNDKKAQKYLDIFAYHDYQGTADWARFAYSDVHKMMTNRRQRLWQTESGYQGDDILTTMKVVNEIHNNLTQVQANAYIWWQGCGDSDLKNFAVIDHDGNIGKRFWALRQYYRFVRPGAVRIQVTTTTNDADLEVTAFVRKTTSITDNWAVVIINKSMVAKAVKLSGLTLPQTFDVYQTSAALNGEKLPSLARKDPLKLPAQSITTLVSGDFHGGINIAEK